VIIFYTLIKACLFKITFFLYYSCRLFSMLL